MYTLTRDFATRMLIKTFFSDNPILSSGPVFKTSNRKFYNYYRDKYIILYYFPIARNTVNKTVSETIYRGSVVCLR